MLDSDQMSLDSSQQRFSRIGKASKKQNLDSRSNLRNLIQQQSTHDNSKSASNIMSPPKHHSSVAMKVNSSDPSLPVYYGGPDDHMINLSQTEQFIHDGSHYVPHHNSSMNIQTNDVGDPQGYALESSKTIKSRNIPIKNYYTSHNPSYRFSLSKQEGPTNYEFKSASKLKDSADLSYGPAKGHSRRDHGQDSFKKLKIWKTNMLKMSPSSKNHTKRSNYPK